jgi:hypothetical protein
MNLEAPVVIEPTKSTEAESSEAYIHLPFASRVEAHRRRTALEAQIRGLKSNLRGKPHNITSSDDQIVLHSCKLGATALYRLLAASRGKRHTLGPSDWRKVCKREAMLYGQYCAKYRTVNALEWVGQTLTELEAQSVSCVAGG